MRSIWIRYGAALAIIVAVLAVYRAGARERAESEIELSVSAPHWITPLYDRPEVATDEQLAAVLDRLVPPKGDVDTNIWLHALRLWGPKADFNDPAIPSGAKMCDFFLNDVVFRAVVGEDAPPLVEADQVGVRIRSYDRDDLNRRTSSVHTDDVLATFGEIGVPTDHVLHTRDGDVTVAELIRASMRRFHTVQGEYEWSTISFARYVMPTTSWKNQYGQKIDVGDLIEECIEPHLRQGVCGGTHRLEALVVLLRADDIAPALSRRERRRITEHLAGVSRLLVATQQEAGYWTKHWGDLPKSNDVAPLSERILATGHHLEWLALAPVELQPPRETIVRAAQWLVRAMLEVDKETIAVEYGPFSHSARALCLWRSQDPYVAWKSARGKPKELAQR